MKRIEALIPHDRVQEVGRGLTQSGMSDLTLTSVYSETGSIQQFSATRKNRGFGNPCCKLDVLVSNKEFARVQSVLLQILETDLPRQIFVVDLEIAIGIGAGEAEEAPLAAFPDR